MKIAVVTQYFPVREQPYRGHSAYQTLLKLKQWADVEVFAPQSQYPRWLLPRNRPWASTDLSYRDSNFNVHYFNYPAFPVLTRAINGWTCAYNLEPLLRAARPDVILNYWIYPDGFAAVHVGRKLGIPVVVKTIGSDLNALSGPVARRLTKHVMDRAQMVLAVSHDLRRTAIGFGVLPSKVHAILNGCDTSVFHPMDRADARQRLGLSADVQAVLYVGRLDVLKGLRELVTACAELSRGRREMKLFLVGEGPARSELEKLAESLGIRERVVFAGVCDSPTVATWIAACDIFALPSYAEGCPNAVIEALNCGRPVVATNVGGIPELIDEHRGVLVPPRNVAFLAEALQFALSRTWDCDGIAARSRRGWENVAHEVLDLLETLVQTPHRQPSNSGAMRAAQP